MHCKSKQLNQPTTSESFSWDSDEAYFNYYFSATSTAIVPSPSTNHQFDSPIISFAQPSVSGNHLDDAKLNMARKIKCSKNDVDSSLRLTSVVDTFSVIDIST